MVAISRPYEWWKVIMIAVCVAATVAVYTLPLQFDLPWSGTHLQLQEFFYLDPSNPALMTIGLVTGVIAAALIELTWWLTGHVTGGERRRLWKARD